MPPYKSAIVNLLLYIICHLCYFDETKFQDLPVVLNWENFPITPYFVMVENPSFYQTLVYSTIIAEVFRHQGPVLHI